MDFIKGVFKKYIFKSDKGYVIGLFKVLDCSDNVISYKDRIITFTGYFHELNENDTYIFNGNLVYHERYGEQFNVVSYSIVLPEAKDNIVEFLSSDLFSGIGKKKAEKIVRVLGDNALDVIINTPDNLLLVPGITTRQKDIIYNGLKKYQSSFDIIINLTKLGFSTKDALLIYNFYKEKTLDIINSNPYKVTYDLDFINFTKIEKIKRNLGIEENNIERIKASIRYVIDSYQFESGNTSFTHDEIVFLVKKKIFFYDESVIDEAISSLLDMEVLVSCDNYYYLFDTFVAEKYIASRLYNLASETCDLKKEINFKSLEEYFNIKYDDIQIKAITSALKDNVLVITGGPGTGKTTIIKGICKCYQDYYNLTDKDLIKKVALLAPTGRASKRISEQTNLPAYTIHRFLKWNKEDNSFRINEDNPSDVEMVIVDEASMIDTMLFYNLLCGINPWCKVIIIGDYNQLPSIGSGQVLKDIIESDIIDVIELKNLYRQCENSNINIFAHNIINNVYDEFLFNVDDDLTFIPCSAKEVKEKLKEFIITYKDLDYNKLQVMAPIYKGENGIDDLNTFIQGILNEKKATKNEISINGTTFRENDKVLQLNNMFDENVFNGDIGTINEINNNSKEISIDYYNSLIKFSSNDFSSFTLGYAISIHKSQGSEFDIVIIPVLNSYYGMLYKKLIYTAITRARKRLILIGEESALKKAISNNKDDSKRTSLKKFLYSCIKNDL